MAKKPVKITEVVLRDAHQSLLATRMTMDEMRPILPEMDKIPYFSVECWGGATFDSCIRFLDEDPWERLRTLRKELPHQKLQMLFRGQNMLGYRPYADDVVEYFVQKSVANGIDVIRIFDALNDPRNLQTAIKAANKEGAHVQACISYTLSPVHTNEYFVEYAKTLESMGANSICIKDMAGLLKPYTTYELVKKLKETVSIPIDVHSHYTAGLASMSILKGIEAGADIVDTAMSPLALGTSHMPTESLVAALQGTDYDTGLDLNQLNVVRAYFAKLREKYIASGQISAKSLGVDANTLLYQVPGGMFSNMLKQLKDAGKEDKLDDVLAEIPRVREDAGYPPLVTPTSQIVGTQAVFNVIMGERYKMVTKEFKGMVHGDYGKTPAPISPAFTAKILKGEEPITCRFADTLEPELDKLKAEAAKYVIQEEDVLTYAMFPQVAPKFFEKRNARLQGVDANHVDYASASHPV
ncbi:MAG: oxaloacetate decarboxylase subunit alpha [Gemmiger sp.]